VPKKSLYLVDISSFIFRAFYAVRPLTAPDGTPVNAVYGVVTMLSKLINNRKPDHLVICCDSKERNNRLDIYPEYKANRDSPPEELIPQFDLIYEFVRHYPMKILANPGFEADDVIATLAKKYKDDPDMEVIIVTQDKDLMQLVDDENHVSLFDAANDRMIHEAQVVEKFGVPPNKVVDVQSLCGDASDNVPGVSGIGPKTATKLILEYGSLENVLANAANVKGKMGERLQADYEKALLSKKLVKLIDDIPMDPDWDAFTLPPADVDALMAFYKRLGFKTLLRDLDCLRQSAFFDDSPTGAVTSVVPSHPVFKPMVSAQFICVDELALLRTLVDEIKATPQTFLAFDTETNSLNPHQAHLVGVSFCFDAKQAYYIPVGHTCFGNLPLAETLSLLSEVLSDPKIPKVAQNAKFDMLVLATHGLEVKGLTDDTLLASYLSDPETPHNLDYLAQKYLGHVTVKFSDVVSKGKTFADVPLDLATNYAAEDAWVAYCLREPILQELIERELLPVYRDIEIPLVSVLTRMERNGVLIDLELLDGMKKEFTHTLAGLEESIHSLAGGPFNINSPKQLAEILFNKLQLPVVKKNKSGPSTDVDVLTELARQHELPAYLLRYRTITKLLSTYVEQLRTLMNPKTGRVHTSYNQAIAATGRLSSVEPNLQNIPIKTNEGKRIREAFIAPNGHVLLSADYSQIELRLLAAFSKDPNLLDAYLNDQDIHARTAAHIFGIDIKDITAKQRSIGKTINFGVIYGQSAFGLSQQLEVSQSEAKHFIEGFYREFSRVRDYKEAVLDQAKKLGYVTTYLGRRRYFPDINSRNRNIVQNSERMAFNTVFQGSAADLIKKAMIQIDAELRVRQLATLMIMQVHDELIFEVPNDELSQVDMLVSNLMSGAFDLIVPLKVTISHGKNWAKAH